MILGRPANLFLGAFTAIFNVFVLGHIFGFSPSPDLVAAINIAAGAVITLIAGTNANALVVGSASIAATNAANGGDRRTTTGTGPGQTQ